MAPRTRSSSNNKNTEELESSGGGVDLVKFREKLESMAEDAKRMSPQVQLKRGFVKETILRAYEFQRAINILKDLLANDERVMNDPVLSSMFQSEIDQKEPIIEGILELPDELLSPFEIPLIKLVKYQLVHNLKEIEYLQNYDKDLGKWVSYQRQRINKYKDNQRKKTGDALEVLLQDIALFERLNLRLRVIQQPKFYDEYMTELREYKAKYGHIKVGQRSTDGTLSKLGEWVKRLRKEYEMLQNNEKVPTLTPERIVELNEMGMIWKIRHGRPKKGDPRFRLRRKSDGTPICQTTPITTTTNENVNHSTFDADCNNNINNDFKMADEHVINNNSEQQQRQQPMSEHDDDDDDDDTASVSDGENADDNPSPFKQQKLQESPSVHTIEEILDF